MAAKVRLLKGKWYVRVHYNGKKKDKQIGPPTGPNPPSILLRFDIMSLIGRKKGL